MVLLRSSCALRPRSASRFDASGSVWIRLEAPGAHILTIKVRGHQTLSSHAHGLLMVEKISSPTRRRAENFDVTSTLNGELTLEPTGRDFHFGRGGDGQRVFDPGRGVHRHAPVAPRSDLRVLSSHLGRRSISLFQVERRRSVFFISGAKEIINTST